MKIIGLDPGLRATGWGVLNIEGNNLTHIANGVVKVKSENPLSIRLAMLFCELKSILETYHPEEAAVEKSFVSQNSSSTLKLGHARGVIMLAPALSQISVSEYSPNVIKKSLVGSGHASKEQVKMMVSTLLPGASPKNLDAADALGVAVCHAHHRNEISILGATWRSQKKMVQKK